MIFNTHPVPERHSKYIEAIFHYEHFIPDHSVERVVPTGHLFLIFELDGMERNTFDNETLKPNASFTRVWVSGMHKKYISISAHRDSEMFVVQFKGHGAYPYFHFPIQEINDKVIAAEEILGSEILELHKELKETTGKADKFSLAEKWLDSRFQDSKQPSEELVKVIEALRKEPVGKHDEITQSYPNTQKHLIDQFKKYAGLTPKYYQRILRFNEIFQQMKTEQSVSWAQIAYQCGFSDQSHFIKEFKHFSGFNPEKFIQQNYNPDEPNFFPLDREG
ncbi:MAG: AraC family transcriptional regulator [Bacteroidota bacterium]